MLHALCEHFVRVLRKEAVGLLARVVSKVVHRMIRVVAFVFYVTPSTFEAMLGGCVSEPATARVSQPG